MAKRPEIRQCIGKDIILGVRPENLHNEPEYIEKYSDAVIDASVEVVELMGSETFLYLSCADSQFTARVSPTARIKSGDKLKIAINTGKIHLFDKETEAAILKYDV